MLMKKVRVGDFVIRGAKPDGSGTLCVRKKKLHVVKKTDNGLVLKPVADKPILNRVVPVMQEYAKGVGVCSADFVALLYLASEKRTKLVRREREGKFGAEIEFTVTINGKEIKNSTFIPVPDDKLIDYTVDYRSIKKLLATDLKQHIITKYGVQPNQKIAIKGIVFSLEDVKQGTTLERISAIYKFQTN